MCICLCSDRCMCLLFSCSFNTAKVLSIQKQNKTKHFHGVDSKQSETISK